MATVQNLARPGVIDQPFISPNRKVAALGMPLYAGEIVLNTTNQTAYVAVPPVSQGGLAATDWIVYSVGLGLN
jgi:hypothetical protein